MRDLVICTPRIDGEFLASRGELIRFLQSSSKLIFIDPITEETEETVPLKEISHNIYELNELSDSTLNVILETILTFDTLLMFKDNILFAMFNDDFTNITLSLQAGDLCHTSR